MILQLSKDCYNRGRTRNIRPKMTVRVFSEIMALAFVELERMKIKEIGSQVKAIGTIVSLGGALLMILYKGLILQAAKSSAHTMHPENVNDPSGSHWLVGALYPAEMSLATWICFAGAIQNSVVTIFMERKHPEAWCLDLDSRLFAPVNAGIVASAIPNFVQGYVTKTMGPVFVSSFSPLQMIMVAALSCIFLKEKLHLGSIIGGVVVVAGLYLVVWGKSKEQQQISQQGRQQQQLPIEDETSTVKSIVTPVTC